MYSYFYEYPVVYGTLCPFAKPHSEGLRVQKYINKNHCWVVYTFSNKTNPKVTFVNKKSG